MEGHLNCANLLAFVQVGVAMNFGLLHIKQNSVFSLVHEEYMRYLKAISKECIDNADEKIKELKVDSTNEEIRKEKALAQMYLNKLKHVLKRGFKYPHLSCWGVYSGTFGFLFLLFIGLLDWKYDLLLQDILVVLAEVIFFQELHIWYRLHKHCKDEAARIRIAVNFQWLIILSCLGMCAVCYDYIFRLPCDIDYFIILCSLICYMPTLWFIGLMLYELVEAYYWRIKCEKAIEYFKYL